MQLGGDLSPHPNSIEQYRYTLYCIPELIDQSILHMINTGENRNDIHIIYSCDNRDDAVERLVLFISYLIASSILM